MTSPTDLGVPSSPEDAQELLYYLIGKAVARCQIAEAAARNYLVHGLLSDHGGWKGVPGWDSPELYRKLYAYIVATHKEVAIFKISGEGIEPID